MIEHAGRDSVRSSESYLYIFFINNKKARVTLNFAKMQHNNQTYLKSFYSNSIIFSAVPSKFNTKYIMMNTVSAAFIILE